MSDHCAYCAASGICGYGTCGWWGQCTNCPCCPPLPVFGAFALKLIPSLFASLLSVFIVIGVLWRLGYVRFETPRRATPSTDLKAVDSTTPRSDAIDKKTTWKCCFLPPFFLFCGDNMQLVRRLCQWNYRVTFIKISVQKVGWCAPSRTIEL